MKNPDKLLAHKPLVDQYLKQIPRHLSPFHFSSIFLWQDFFEFEFETIDDSLCIFARQPKAIFLYLPPLASQISPRVIERCFKKMDAVNAKTARIENVEENQLDIFNNGFKTYSKLQEYVYQKRDLIDLKGHAYKSQRHDIHHFQSHHQALFRPYQDSDFLSCMDLYQRWARHRHDKHQDEVYRQMLQENKIVHELALQFYRQLDLVGCVVEIDKKIAAYSFGYSLNSQTFCVSLEITEPQCTGLSAFVFNRFCESEDLREYTLINTMDDFGLPYVAASKQAYHPSTKPVSYTITQHK